MIFRQWEQVLDGTKTQMRQLVKEGERAVNLHGRIVPDYVWGNTIDAVYSSNGGKKWQVWHAYAIQPGRGKKAVGHIRVTGIRRERLQDISFNDMLCEGYPIALFSYTGNFNKNPVVDDWFMALWDSINIKRGTRWIDNPEVWCLSFELVDCLARMTITR